MKTFLLFTTLIALSFLCYSCCTAKELIPGKYAPNFNLMDQDGNMVKLSDFRGKKVAVYFYPKDNTPGCTQEACSLRDKFDELRQAGIIVLGLSKGSIKSKKKFIKKQHLNFPLLIATKGVLRAYGIDTGLLHLYLPKRWTFLINESGIIVKIIKNVDTKNHAQQILQGFNAVQ